MNAKKYQKKIDKLKKKNEYLKQINELETEGDKYKRKTPYTKKIMMFILINCTIVELYSMFAMTYTNDLSSLCTLITAVVGESISFAIYSYKSIKENTQGGIVYESAMNNNTSTDTSSVNMPVAGFDGMITDAQNALLNNSSTDQQNYNAFNSIEEETENQ